MWDGVKSPSSKRKKISFTRRYTIKGNGTKVKTLQKGKNPKNSRLEFQTQRKFHQERGLFKREPSQGGC
jgi:hypothetical protein